MESLCSGKVQTAFKRLYVIFFQNYCLLLLPMICFVSNKSHWTKNVLTYIDSILTWRTGSYFCRGISLSQGLIVIKSVLQEPSIDSSDILLIFLLCMFIKQWPRCFTFYLNVFNTNRISKCFQKQEVFCY